MSDLKPYRVRINGMPHTFLLSDEDAARYNLGAERKPAEEPQPRPAARRRTRTRSRS